jgi:hypothetical protein
MNRRALLSCCPEPRLIKAVTRLWCSALLGLALHAGAHAADPVRGAQLFASPPRPGMLSCADCHSEDPVQNNFGNIWSGRNAQPLIERAVQNNTGGMAVFLGLYGTPELSDIAAYLGNSPSAPRFADTTVGLASLPVTVTVSASVKQAIEGLRVDVQGTDFSLRSSTCGPEVRRFSSCTLDLVFLPTAPGLRQGTLVLEHAHSPTAVRLPLVGNGLERPRSTARASETLVTFPAATSEEGVRRNVLLINSGPAPLRVGMLRVEPEQPGMSDEPNAQLPVVVAGGTCGAGVELPPAAHCVVALRHQPPPATGRAAATAWRGRLHMAHDGVGGQTVVELRTPASPVTLPALYLDRGDIDFGALPPPQFSPVQLLTVTNSSAQAMTLGAVTLSHPAFRVAHATCVAGLALAPGHSCTLGLVFQGIRNGPFSAELRLTAAGHDHVWRLPLFGHGGAARLQPAAQQRLWQGVVGQSSVTPLVWVNTGSAAVSVAGVDLLGPKGTAFALASPLCHGATLVQPGASCITDLGFSPLVAGPHRTRIRIRYAADAPGPSADVLVVAQAAMAPEPRLWLDATQLDFGFAASRQLAAADGARVATPLGTAPIPSMAALAEAADRSTQTLRLGNAGAVPLSMGGMQLLGHAAGDFALSGPCTSLAALAPGADCELQVTFLPRAAGLRTASLLVSTTAALPPAVVSLRGQGAAQPTAAWQADVARLDFGDAAQGTSVRRSLRLQNVGAAAAPAPMFHLQGPFAIASLQPSCHAALAPGQSCVVELAFSQAQHGAAMGALTVAAAGVAPLKVDLSARSVSADEPIARLSWVRPAPFAGAALDLGPAAVGQTVEGPLWTVVNAGSGASNGLVWRWVGEGAGEFSLHPDSTCVQGARLAAGAACTVRVRFHPGAPGRRAARLVLAQAGALDALPLQGRGRGLAHAGLQAAPAVVGLERSQGDAALASQWASLVNTGSEAVQWVAPGAEDTSGPFVLRFEDSCAGPAPVLLPAERCAFQVGWRGDASVTASEVLVLQAVGGTANAELQVAVVRTEARPLAKGGGAFAVLYVMCLVLAAAGLFAARKRGNVVASKVDFAAARLGGRKKHQTHRFS